MPLLAVLGSVVALGIGTSFGKQLFPQVGALGTTALRVGFSALILLLIWRPWRWTTTRADARSLVRYGIALGCMNLMFYQSIQTIPFGVAVAIEFSGPLAVAFFTSRRAIDYLWIAFAIVGLGLLLPLGHDVTSLDPVGVMFGLGAAVFWAAYILFGKKVGHLHAGHSVALGLTMAAVTVVPFGPWIICTASSSESPSVEVPSIERMRSPALRPAFSAGESLSGEITVSTPSAFSPITMPTPSKLPLISSLKDFASVGGKKVVYGSPNDAASPWIAP